MSFLFGGGDKTVSTSQNKLSGVRIQTSSQGVPIPIVYGETRVSNNLLWYGDFTAIPHTTSQTSGGKGGGSVTSTQTSYTYTVGAILGVCEGPITGYGKVWEDKNVTTTAALGLTEFTGSYTQNAWSYMTTYHPTQAFSYRGSAYCAGGAINLGNSNSLPNISFEVNGFLYGASSSVTYYTNPGKMLASFAYNPSAGEIWATVTTAVSPFSDVVRLAPSNGVVLGYLGIPTYTDGSEIVYDSYNACVWLPGNEISNPVDLSKIDAVSGAVLVHASPNVYFMNPDPYNGEVWAQDAASFSSIVKINTANLARTVTGNLGFNMGGVCYDSHGTMWLGDHDHNKLYTVNRTTGVPTLSYTFSGLPSSLLAPKDIAFDSVRNCLWILFIYATTPAAYIVKFDIATLSVLSTNIINGNWQDSFNECGSNPKTKFYNPTNDTFCLTDYVSGRILVLNASDFSTKLNVASTQYQGQYFANIDTTIANTILFYGLNPATNNNEIGVLKFSSATGPFALDVNPEAVTADVLPNANYGAGFPLLQMGDWSDWNNYCNQAGIAVSPAYVSQASAATMVTELTMIGNAGPIWSGGLLKMIPYADANVGTYVPNTTINYALTDDDYIAAPGEPPVKVTRKRQADAYNQVQVEVLDRTNDYNTYVAEAKDQWNIDTYGLRPMPLIQAHMICQPSVGRDLAQRILQRALYIRNEYEYTLSWKYSRLEPMDLVSLTDSGLGLNATPVRITSVEEDDTGNLAMLAEDYLGGGLTAGSYSTQAGNGAVINTHVPPGNAVAPIIFQPPIALTGNAQIAIASAGGANWGGAQIWASSDNTAYFYKGIIANPGRFGTLTANLPAGADPDVTNTLAVDLTTSLGSLLSVPQAQADALNTLSYVDGEILAYETANLTSAHHYNITYLRRGKYGTTSQKHLTSSTFLRLDDSVVYFDIDPSWVGTTIYVKLLSYNTTGGNMQSLADVSPTPYVVQYTGMATATVPNLIPKGQYYYIAAGTQAFVSHRMTIYGRLQDFGRLIVN